MEGEGSMYKQLLVPLFVTLALFVGAITIPTLIQAGKHISLEKATALAGPVSLALGSGDSQSLPRYGEDFSFGDIRTFESSWKVIRLVSESSSNDGMVVLHNTGGAYRVVLGPGTSFAKSEVQTLPVDLVQFLNNEGMLYESL